MSVVVGTRPVLGADPIPTAKAVVTIKDYNFFTTGDNPVGVAVDPRGNLKVGLLGLPIPGPRAATQVQTITPDGETSTFTGLPLALDLAPCRSERPGRDMVAPGVMQEPTPFMTGIVYHRNGDLYAGLPNCDPNTHGIWKIAPNGTAQVFAKLPISQLPKGLAFTNGSFPLYVTDLHDFTRSREQCRAAMGTSNACSLRIWRIDENGNVMVWLESTMFYGSPDSPLLHPHGVNGIVVDPTGQNVYVTNTDHGSVIRIPVNRDGSAGQPKAIFEDENYWGMDGITFGPDGNLYIVIVRTDQLVALHPDGTGFKVLLQGHPLDGPTQLTFGNRNPSADPADLPPLYITNGSGARVFYFNVAMFGLGQGNLLTGLTQMVNMNFRTAADVIELHPRPSVIRVLLSTRQ